MGANSGETEDLHGKTYRALVYSHMWARFPCKSTRLFCTSSMHTESKICHCIQLEAHSPPQKRYGLRPLGKAWTPYGINKYGQPWNPSPRPPTYVKLQNPARNAEFPLSCHPVITQNMTDLTVPWGLLICINKGAQPEGLFSVPGGLLTNHQSKENFRRKCAAAKLLQPFLNLWITQNMRISHC